MNSVTLLHLFTLIFTVVEATNIPINGTTESSGETPSPSVPRATVNPYWTNKRVFDMRTVLQHDRLNASVGENVMFATKLEPTSMEFLQWVFVKTGETLYVDKTTTKIPPRFAGRVTLSTSTGSLELRNVSVRDSGAYGVHIGLPGHVSRVGSAILIVKDTAEVRSSQCGTGCIVGIVLGFLFMAGLVLIIWKKRKWVYIWNVPTELPESPDNVVPEVKLGGQTGGSE